MRTNQVNKTKQGYNPKVITPARQSCCQKLKRLYHLWLHKRSVSNENCWVFLGSLPFLIVFGHDGYTAISHPDLTWKSTAGWRLWGVQKHSVGVCLCLITKLSWTIWPSNFWKEKLFFFWGKSITLSHVKWVTVKRRQGSNVIFMPCEGYLHTTIQLSHQSWGMHFKGNSWIITQIKKNKTHNISHLFVHYTSLRCV